MMFKFLNDTNYEGRQTSNANPVCFINNEQYPTVTDHTVKEVFVVKHNILNEQNKKK